MPELRQLRVFVAVAEELNFTRAAERLYLGQQAVSKSVRSLERELGVELLERTTREVRLTPAGAALLERGREALAAADAAFAAAQAAGRALAGTVRVGVSPALGRHVVDEAARVLLGASPDVSVSMHEVRPREIPERLRDRDLDLVLARTAPRAPEVDSASLRPTPAVLHVPAGHRLAARTDPVPLAELDGERLLTWNPPGTPFTDLLLTRLAAAGATVEPVEARVTGAPAAQLGVEDVVALVPAGTRPAEGVVELEVADDLSLPLFVLWRAGVPSPAVRRLREAMASER